MEMRCSDGFSHGLEFLRVSENHALIEFVFSASADVGALKQIDQVVKRVPEVRQVTDFERLARFGVKNTHRLRYTVVDSETLKSKAVEVSKALQAEGLITELEGKQIQIAIGSFNQMNLSGHGQRTGRNNKPSGRTRHEPPPRTP